MNQNQLDNAPERRSGVQQPACSPDAAGWWDWTMDGQTWRIEVYHYDTGMLCIWCEDGPGGWSDEDADDRTGHINAAHIGGTWVKANGLAQATPTEK